MTNPLEGWQDIVIPPPKTSREWLQRACGIKADITKWKFTSEEVVTCLSRYAREQNKELKKEIETLKMCASAGEAMGVEMLKLETKNEQLVGDVKLLRDALGKFDEMYDVICDLKDNQTSVKHHEGLTLFINLCLRYGKPALAETDRPEYGDDDNVVT